MNELTMSAQEYFDSGYACRNYPIERLIELWAGLERRVGALDILDFEGVPDADKLFAVLRPEFIPEPTLHELACRYAEQTFEIIGSIGNSPNPRSINAAATLAIQFPEPRVGTHPPKLGAAPS